MEVENSEDVNEQRLPDVYIYRSPPCEDEVEDEDYYPMPNDSVDGTQDYINE